MNLEKMLIELLISQYQGGQANQNTPQTSNIVSQPQNTPAILNSSLTTQNIENNSIEKTQQNTQITNVSQNNVSQNNEQPKWEFTEEMYNSINNTLINLTNLIQTNNRNNPQQNNEDFFV